MKTLRKFCAVLVLAMTLVLPVFAGDVQFPGSRSASDPIIECPKSDVQFPGSVSGCETPNEEDTTDPATEMMLTLLEGLLSLF